MHMSCRLVSFKSVQFNSIIMRNVKELIVALALVLLVIPFSGCTLGGGGSKKLVSGTNGIIIEEFSFSYPTVYSEEMVDLGVTIKNVGDSKASNIKIKLFGPKMTTGQASYLTWGIISDPNGGRDTIISVGSLESFDPATGFYDFWSGDWTLQAPTNLKTDMSYTFNLRVEYSYTTAVEGQITTVTYEYLKSLPKSQRDAIKNTAGVSKISVSGGPISVSVASGRQFVVYQGSTETRKPIRFSVSNVGNGYPYLGDDPEVNPQGLYQIEIIDEDGVEDCHPKTIRLSKGKTGAFTCYVDVTDLTDGKVNRLDTTFSITLRYNYYTDSSTSITVKRKEGSLGGT